MWMVLPSNVAAEAKAARYSEKGQTVRGSYPSFNHTLSKNQTLNLKPKLTLNPNPKP